LEEPADSTFYPKDVGVITYMYIKNNIHTLHFTEHTSNTELSLIRDSDFKLNKHLLHQAQSYKKKLSTQNKQIKIQKKLNNKDDKEPKPTNEQHNYFTQIKQPTRCNNQL
jgi:hypothetical protein